MKENDTVVNNAQDSRHKIYEDVRSKLKSEDIKSAEEILEAIPDEAHSAEWHFLKGCILTHNGWFHDAQTHFDIAHSLEPDNSEYEDAAKSLNDTANNYNNTWQNGSETNKEDKKLCTKSDNRLLCIECCVEGGCECCCEGLCSICDGV